MDLTGDFTTVRLSSSDEGFLQAIDADPTNPAHWANYADWLDEHGELHGSFYRQIPALVASAQEFADQNPGFTPGRHNFKQAVPGAQGDVHLIGDLWDAPQWDKREPETEEQALGWSLKAFRLWRSFFASKQIVLEDYLPEGDEFFMQISST